MLLQNQPASASDVQPLLSASLSTVAVVANDKVSSAVRVSSCGTLRPEHSSGGSSVQQQQQDSETRTHMLDYAPAPGWTVHVNKDGRLYYCNHVTKTAGWLPPAEAWRSADDSLPYGWERALDDSGRSYFINHVNKTTTYETPLTRALLPSEIPQPRTVTLERSVALGFGFVAGSEKPVIVRFVTEGGPSVDKLLPGDQILSVNGENVKSAPREHVISLIRACAATVTMVVCQPPEQQGARKSTLLSASKRARLKTKPSRVRFAESVCVNGAPLFPPSAFSLGDICVPPMANVLKVFLENGQTKSFKYDAWTTVQDVVTSLETKLCLSATQHFSLVVEHIKSLKRNKLTLLDPNDTLARIASRPGAHKLRCLYRIAFVPSSAAALAQQDLAALDYLFTQCCNDVIQERFAPELQYETALRLAALHVYQHALSNNMQASKLTVKNVEEFGLERFVPASLLDKMKRKEVRKLVAHFLKLHANMAGPGKQLTVLQAKLHYLDLVAQLPSYGAKCFQAGPKEDTLERVILVSPKFGISQIIGSRNSVPVSLANIDEISKIDVRTQDELTRTVLIHLSSNKTISVSLEERDACELVLVLKGYYRLATGHDLSIEKEEDEPLEDLAPPYLSLHKVVPEKWSYINQQSIRTSSFSTPPIYQNVNRKTNGLYNTMGRQSKPPLISGFSLDSNMNSTSVKNQEIGRNSYEQIFFEAKNEMLLKKLQSADNKRREVWQETSVDIESDSDSFAPDEEQHVLKHSDSLLLLTKVGREAEEQRNAFNNAAIEMLRSEINYSESDNDSLSNSPKHYSYNNNDGGGGGGKRVSFGLHSPDNQTTTTAASAASESNELRAYLQKLKDQQTNEMYVLHDPDIIDLTLLPPPATPDQLDCALPAPPNLPPQSFADSSLEVLQKNLNLEEFLASVTVPPPTQKVTPSIELTPEEIMSYIIPPPPETDKVVLQTPTVPRRSSIDKPPPERPPKNLHLPSERQRSHSVGAFNGSCSSSNGGGGGKNEQLPPKLPPRDNNQHLFLPPKKPPLPPVPPLELLRSRKSSLGQQQQQQKQTAGIGSPHLQRNKNLFSNGCDAKDGSSTAISTPTSPFLGRGAQFSAIPITDTPEEVAPNRSEYIKGPNGRSCMSSRATLLAKTDVAMASLLCRLDQVAAQCTAAQNHPGGGRNRNQEKFQAAKDELTAQCLQLVHSSKLLVIAMSNPTLPDLPENLAICLTILRRLTELCTDLTTHTATPLQTRNLIAKVHDATNAFRHLITSDVDWSTQNTIEEHLAKEAESLAAVLTTLLRSLRVFSPP